MNQCTGTFKVYGKGGQRGLRFPPEFRELFNALCADADRLRNGYITAKFTLPRRYRSTGKNSQNTKLNGAIQQICTHTGNDFADVKKYVKQQAISMGYPILKDDNNADIIDLWGNVQGISEKDCSVEECSILIKAVLQLADELSIKLYEDDYGSDEFENKKTS